jgi:hypothetical protein
VNLTNISRHKMKIDLTTGTWQDNPGCPINITSVSTSDAWCQEGGGGKKRPLPPMPPPPPRWGRDTPEIKEFRRRRPGCDVYVDRAAHDGSTDARGRRPGGSPVDNDDDDKAEFGSSGIVAFPPTGSGLAGGGGSPNANNGAGRSLRSRQGKR